MTNLASARHGDGDRAALPCYKLGIRFGRPDVVKRVLASERTGFFSRCCKRRRSGWVIRFELIEKSKDSLRLSDVTALYTHEKHNIGLLRRAIEVATLPES